MPATNLPRRADQNRALWLSTIAFTLCFAVWTIFSIIGRSIKEELGIGEFMYGILIATPVLTGSVTRLIRSEEHTSELQSRGQLLCRLLLDTTTMAST